MRILLDTSVFIRMDIAPDRLSERVQSIIIDTDNEIWLSIVSLWEIQIKTQIGKLQLSNSLEETVISQIEQNQIQLLPLNPEHIYGLETLPFHHRDPFDRLLIAQTISAGLLMLTDDTEIQKYPLNWLW